MRTEPEEKKRSPHPKLSGLDKLVFSPETVYFFVCLLPRKPSTRRYVETSYRKICTPYPLFCNLSPYKTLFGQLTVVATNLLRTCSFILWMTSSRHQWQTIVSVAWYGCAIYIKSKIGSSLFVQKKPLYIVYLHQKFDLGEKEYSVSTPSQ